MDIEFINEVRVSMKLNRQSAIKWRDDCTLRKSFIKLAWAKRQFIREQVAIYG